MKFDEQQLCSLQQNLKIKIDLMFDLRLYEQLELSLLYGLSSSCTKPDPVSAGSSNPPSPPPEELPGWRRAEISDPIRSENRLEAKH